MDPLDGLAAYEVGRDVSLFLGVASFALQTDYAEQVGEVLLGMLRDYRERVHARAMAQIDPDCPSLEE